MSSIEINSNKSLKSIDWKEFFNMRIFRYTFLKQLKSVITYICFILAMISNVSSSFLELDNLYIFFLSPLFVLIIFIPNKSLQIFRDEMDDGTLLIFSSMPYSRLKLAIQKWLSLQAVCLMFVLIVILTKPFIYLMTQGFSMPAWEVIKFLSKDYLLFFIYVAVVFQVIFSTYTVLFSLYFGKKATNAFSILSFYLLYLLIWVLMFFLEIDMSIFLNSIFLYGIYPLISLILVIFVIYKKDFA